MDEFTRGWLEAISVIRQTQTEAQHEGHLFDLDVELMLMEDAAYASLLARGLPLEGKGSEGQRYGQPIYHIRPGTRLLH